MPDKPDAIEAMERKPLYYPDPLMMGMFIACATHALSTPKALERFSFETGCTYHPGASPMDRMIDSASGYNADFCRRWLQWVADAIWGVEGQGDQESLP